MKLSDKGLDLIKEFEGYHERQADGSAKAYLCPAGVLTIGWGCTEGVHAGMVVTEAEATAMLAREMAKHEAAVARLVKVPLAQGQYDALVSFSYNVGAGALEGSTLLRLLNAGDVEGARGQFARWNKAAGKELAGLTRRRAREAEVFGAPVDTPRMAQRVEAPVTPALNAATSRKFNLMERWQQLLATVAASPLAVAAADNIQAAKSYADLVKGFVVAYGVSLMIGSCVVMYVLAQIFKELQKQDVAAGRATPSGAASAGAPRSTTP